MTTPAGRRADRTARSHRRHTRWAKVAISTVTALAVTAGIALTLDHGSSSDVTTSLGLTPSTSPSLAPEVTPSEPSLLGSPSPSASAVSPASSSSAKSTRRSTKAGTATGTTAAQATRTTKASTRSGVVLDGRTMGGWYAGAGGEGVADGSFASWLGQPLQIAETWSDGSDEVQRTMSGLANYTNWNGAIDIAVGGTVLGSGESYSAAASGAYDDRWRAAAKVLASVRKGKKGPTFVRPFHEFNGDWFKEWSINSSNVADYKAAFRRYAEILKAALPEVYVVWCPNSGDHSGVPVTSSYPGDDIVDVIAPDYYHDGSSEDPSSTTWRDGSPLGMEAWRQFAAQHGKPIGMPEWGLKPDGGGDSPDWIKAVNTWATQHANTATWQIGAAIPKSAAGKVLYTNYFNVVYGGDTGYTIHGFGANPQSEAMYKSLTWGNVG